MIDRLQQRSSRAGKVAMMVVALAAVFVLVFSGEIAGWLAGDHGAAVSRAPTTFYTCSMDPSVESDHPGTCPICGMALTPVTQQERSSGTVRVATKARALIGLDVAPVQKRTMWKRIVATGEVEPATAARRTTVAARVYRGDPSEVRSGESVVVTAREIPLQQFAGTVVEPTAEPGTLRIAVDNPEQLLRPGMLVDVKLEVELEPRLAVPATAVLYAGKRRIVFVEKAAGAFEPRTPELGMASDGLVEVVSGLAENDQVAITGTFLLGAESRIRSDGTLWGERPEPAKHAPAKQAPQAPSPPSSPSTGW